jgi:hypothetical protein
MRHYPALIAIVLVAACQSSTLEPGDTLSGHWINANASLDANQNTVVFVLPCDRAEFGPIVLDANRSFAADSRVFTEVGNIIHFPDDRLHIQGTVVGNTITLTINVFRSSGGGSDPIAVTLTQGKTQPAPVCVA